MKRTKREERRRAAEARKQIKKKERNRSRARAQATERAIKESLAKPRGVTEDMFDAMFSGHFEHPDRNINRAAEALRDVARYCAQTFQTKRFRDLMRLIVSRSPKIADHRYWYACYCLSRFAWIRDACEWTPRGKSSDSIFRSLIDHLTVEYPMPRFLYSAFFLKPTHDRYAHPLMEFFTSTARGASAFRHFSDGRLPARMTRRMCHTLMQTTGDMSFYEALRHAQVQTLGGDRSLASALAGTFLGRGFADDEGFWFTVIRWFCTQEKITPGQVGPLVDYVAHVKHEDHRYSIKGRTVRSLTRAMDEWHRDLARAQKGKGTIYPASGLKEGIWEFKGGHSPGPSGTIIWTVEEILTSKDLAFEGRSMKHCVFSYGRWIEQRRYSIWTLRRDSERMLTVQVDNQRGEIVQARGKYNRAAAQVELNVLRRWATENNLTLHVR